MRIDEIDERILFALQEGPKRLKEIGSMLESRRTAKRRTAKLFKYGLIKRISQGVYALTPKGKAYIDKQTVSGEVLSIGQDIWDKVSTFIMDKVPIEVYQAVVRLTLSEMRAKQSELFSDLKNQFTGGWSGVALGGKPKALKTPIAELICKIVGLNPEKQKFPTTATKSELGAAYQKEGGAWKYRPSPWHKGPFIIFDDWHRIITKDTRETVLSLAQGSRTFRRYGETFINHPVPFITLNTHTEAISETTKKIVQELGEEYVKRLVTVNVDHLSAYLEDAAILTRKMLRSVPRLNFKAFPLRKKGLTDEEFSILCELLKESTDPDKRQFFDERSVEILVLGRYALAKGQDIVGTIYQTCWDRLLCLETLGVTKDGWRQSFRKKWKKYVSTEQPKVLEELKREEKREEEWKRKIEKKTEEKEEKEVKKKEEKARQALALKRRKGELKANLNQLKSELPSPQKKQDGWGNKQIPIREQINTLLSWIGEAKTEEKLQVCESQYPEVKSDWQDFMHQYRGWEKKQEEEALQKEQANQALKVKKDKWVSLFQDLRKRFGRFRLKEERAVVEKAKNLVDNAVEKIQEAKDLEELKEMEGFFPTWRGKLEEKLRVLERRRELIREVQNYLGKLDQFDRQEEKEEVRERKQILEELLLKIYQAESEENLRLVDSLLFPHKMKVDDLILSFRQRKAEQEAHQKDREQVCKEQNQIQKQINKLQKEKGKIKEQLNKDVFRKEDLSPQERALLETLNGYRKRKTVPTDNLTSFFEKLSLIRKVNSQDKIQTGPNRGRTIYDVFFWSYFERFGSALPVEIYFAIDGQVYPLNHFTSWNWDQAKVFIHTVIEQLRTLAKKRRKEKLNSEWDRLDKQEQELKPPLFYVRTNRRLVWARHFWTGEDQRLHFELQDGRVWMLPQGRVWMVHTKLAYGGQLLPFVSEGKSIVEVETDKGNEKISKNSIFSYIYQYKGPEPG